MLKGSDSEKRRAATHTISVVSWHLGPPHTVKWERAAIGRA